MDEDVVDIGKELLKFADILDNVLNAGPLVTVPVIDDGLNDCEILYGLREWVGGSGLKAILDESKCQQK